MTKKFIAITALLTCFNTAITLRAMNAQAAELLPDEKAERFLNDSNYLLLVVDVEYAYFGMGTEREGPLDPVVLRVLYEVEKAKKDGVHILFLEYFTFTAPHLINAILDYKEATFLPKKKSSSGAKEVDDFIQQNNINRDVIIKVAGVELAECVKSTCFDLKDMGYDVHLLKHATNFRAYWEKILNDTLRRFEDKGIKVQDDSEQPAQIIGEIDPRVYAQIANNFDDPDFKVRTAVAIAFGYFEPREKVQPYFEKALEFLTHFRGCFHPPTDYMADDIIKNASSS